MTRLHSAVRTASLVATLVAVTVLAGCSGGSAPISAPVFTPGAGTYTTPQQVQLTTSSSGAQILYGTSASAKPSTPYTGPIPVATTTTLYAIAVSGSQSSVISSATYTLNLPAVTTPVISPNGGNFTAAQAVTITDPQAGASIYYTTDGSTPSSSSTAYTAPFEISAAGATTVKAIAVLTNYPNSAVASATFNLTLVSATPTYTYKNVQIVGGGFVDGLYFHPKSQGLMYAKTDIGGAYRWNNVSGGDTQWVPLLNFVGRFYSGFDQGVDSLALDPNDPSKLYLAVGEYADSYGQNGTILISSDMG